MKTVNFIIGKGRFLPGNAWWSRSLGELLSSTTGKLMDNSRKYLENNQKNTRSKLTIQIPGYSIN